MTRRVALASCTLALLGAAVGAQHSFERVPSRSSIATSKSSTGPLPHGDVPPRDATRGPVLTAIATDHNQVMRLAPGHTRDVAAAHDKRSASRDGAPFIRLRLSPADRVAAARMIANEDARPLRPASDGGTDGALTLDSYAILQVVHDVARAQGWSHRRALRALAPHVAGSRAPTQRRHAIYRTLPAYGTAKPALWDDSRDGPWSVYAPNWARLRDGVSEAIGNGFPAVSATPIVAWGCPADDSIALSRGLVLATVPSGAVNRYWARAVLAASEAGGAR